MVAFDGCAGRVSRFALGLHLKLLAAVPLFSCGSSYLRSSVSCDVVARFPPHLQPASDVRYRASRASSVGVPMPFHFCTTTPPRQHFYTYLLRASATYLLCTAATRTAPSHYRLLGGSAFLYRVLPTLTACASSHNILTHHAALLACLYLLRTHLPVRATGPTTHVY